MFGSEFGGIYSILWRQQDVLPDPSLVRHLQPPGLYPPPCAGSALASPHRVKSTEVPGWLVGGRNQPPQQSESNSYVLTTNLLFTFSRICFSFRAMASPFRFLIRFFSSFLQAYIFPVARTWQAQTWRKDKAQHPPTAVSGVGV